MNFSSFQNMGDVRLNLKYFINSALQKKIPWNSLTFFLNDLAPTLEKSKEVVEILVKELEKLALKLEESLIEENEEPEIVEDYKNCNQDNFKILTGFENKYYTFVGENTKARESNCEQQDTEKGEDLEEHILEENERYNSDVSEMDDVVESFPENNEDFYLLENEKVVDSFEKEPITDSSENQIKQASQVAMESEQNEEASKELDNDFYVFIGDESDCKAEITEIDSKRSSNEKILKGKKMFDCNICFKTFTSKNNLKDHTRIHTGEKPFQCKECGKHFSSNSGLIQHRQIHTETKKYQCKSCCKSFAWLSSFKVHGRIHAGEKPFKCKTCSKSFNDSTNLKVHENGHRGEKSFKCKNCNKCYTQKSDLSKHVKTYHS